MAVVPATCSGIQTLVNAANSSSKCQLKVLEEDEYVANLEYIIQRDFFPDVEKLRAQNEYLEAVENNDLAKIKDLQQRYVCRPTGVAQRVPRFDNVSLDAFLRQSTSEDNASFEEIVEAEEAKRYDKNAWMYCAEQAHKENICKQQALLGADEQLALPAPRVASVGNWFYSAKNSLMFIPEGAKLTAEEMEIKKKNAERVIVHKNTRFNEDPFAKDATQPLLNKSAVALAAAGQGKVDVLGNEIKFGNAMQKFSTVVTPSPMPGLNESPLMTWGEIEGTPFRLDAGDTPIPRTPGPSFKIPDIPLRDQLAQSITEEVLRKNRVRKQANRNAASSLTPKFSSVRSMERLSTMSPAAKRLASTKLGVRVATDKRHNLGYTPSPSRTPKHTPLISTEKLTSKTPAAKICGSTAEDSSEKQQQYSLTDNLLNLRKQPTASDFF
ncbi:unnamed protein product [Soboliphyme baturini]|uniref:Protein DGCR14 n=1 Tax=Soboliphyme baturini TaxID=241478 RepID=A0A183ID13_9BILA|nr:unnamed protein product [Soboliphyme baturini]